MTLERLDPRDDLVFKILLSTNEDILIALLSAVLSPATPIVSAVVQDPGIPRTFPNDKGSVLDVHVLLDDGTRVDVEMQCARVPYFRDRALYYWSQLFSMQLEAGQSYEELARVVSILFLDYREFDSGKYHKTFRLLEGQTGLLFTTLQEIHTIELPLLARAGTDSLSRWARFLASEDSEELERLAEVDPMIHKAEQKLHELSADARLREELRQRKGNAVAQRLALSGAFHEGRAEGREEGRAEGLENQRRMLMAILTSRFGALQVEDEARVAGATAADLVRWAERAAAVRELADVWQ